MSARRSSKHLFRPDDSTSETNDRDRQACRRMSRAENRSERYRESRVRRLRRSLEKKGRTAQPRTTTPAMKTGLKKISKAIDRKPMNLTCIERVIGMIVANCSFLKGTSAMIFEPKPADDANPGARNPDPIEKNRVVPAPNDLNFARFEEWIESSLAELEQRFTSFQTKNSLQPHRSRRSSIPSP